MPSVSERPPRAEVESWETVSPYCRRSGSFTVVKVGSASGWRYELWHGKEQVSVNHMTAQDAVDAIVSRLSTGDAA
jgi:hypothetical protein